MDIQTKVCDCSLNKGETKTEDDSFPTSLQCSINSIIKKEGYETYNVFKRSISTEGGNYLATLYEVDVKGKTTEGTKETSIFIKNVISNDAFKMVSISDAYIRELFVYKELSKVLIQLQDEGNVPMEDRFKMPVSYDESNTEAIILENLSRRGFDTGYRMDVMSLKFAELSVQQLGKFHGLSYVLQRRRPDYFEKHIKPMKQSFLFNEDFEISVRNMWRISSQPLDDSLRQKTDKFLETFLEKFPKYMEDTTSVGCCLCHGDYRMNNIMMKEIDGEATEVMPVDYQILYYGCPVNDLLFFIFTASDQEFRKHHLNDLKNMYYDSLAKFLQYFDMDVEDVYPRKEFEAQYKEKLDYGLMIMMFGTPFLFAEAEDAVDILNAPKVDANVSVRMDKKYEDRIRGLVDDFIHWGYL